MCLIYLLAGAFASVAKQTGGVDAVVNLGLSVVPSAYLVACLDEITRFNPKINALTAMDIESATACAAAATAGISGRHRLGRWHWCLSFGASADATTRAPTTRCRTDWWRCV